MSVEPPFGQLTVVLFTFAVVTVHDEDLVEKNALGWGIS